MSSHAERLQQLQEMGFSEQQARAGLAKFSNNVGRAVEWLFEATPDVRRACECAVTQSC